ncbi:MAG TPA: D-2-hydroxyacid dehydrogenase [Chloroflexota bacterium]|nr:D-2-hydroxyacid dehydrogenase [Chloroflexota bacterium]
MTSQPTVTVLLSHHFPAEAEPRIRAISPRIRLLRLPPEVGPAPTDAGDAEVLAWWEGGSRGLADLRAALPRLRWLQAPAAGIGDRRLHLVLGPDVLVTSAAGVYSDMVAEHVLALTLALYKRLPDLFDLQRQGQWRDLPTRTLQGRTMGIIGAGGIGRATARLARAFGMRVIGVRRGEGEVPELDQTLPLRRLPDLLGASDVVVLTAPLTEETRGMVNAAFLRAMRPSAVLVNVARGGLVVTDALVRALTDRWIGGAALDVTDPEPLPEGHPLWHAPNTIITPHHANPSEASVEPITARFCENLRRYLAGEPLLAVVDPARGY